jgi:hypothetical protein
VEDAYQSQLHEAMVGGKMRRECETLNGIVLVKRRQRSLNR